MTNPMIEQVAKAIHEALGPTSDVDPPLPWDMTAEPWREDARRLARTAIAAMREPSEAVLAAGPGEPYMDTYVWARIIDAALKDTP
jgi:hypothetical protein